MAKKFRCSTCGNIVEIDSTLEVITCPQCGKKYRNSYYDPYARMMGQAATLATPPNAQYMGGFGMPMYGAPYGAPYGAQPFMPYGAAAAGVAAVAPAAAQQTEPVAEKQEEEAAEEAIDEDILDLDESDEAEEQAEEAAEEEVEEESEQEFDDIAYAAKKKTTLKRIVGKRVAYGFILAFSLLLLAIVGLRAANVLQSGYGNYLNIFKETKFTELIKGEVFWSTINFVPVAMAALTMFVLSAMHLSVADLKASEIKTGKSLNKQLKSGKLAGYAFALIFSIIALAYCGLYGVGGMALQFKEAFGGGLEEGANVLEMIRLYINPYVVNIGLTFVSLVALTYFSFRISDTNKQYK